MSEKNAEVKNLKLLKCEICGKNISSLKNLRSHINTIHSSEKRESHPCNLCGKKFTVAKSLTRHISVIHEQVKQFKCDNCDKAFGQKHHLDRHMKFVHPINPDMKLVAARDQRYSNRNLVIVQ